MRSRCRRHPFRWITAAFATPVALIFAVGATTAVTTCPSGSRPVPSSVPAGTKGEAQVSQYLQSQGLSPVAAAGIVGNLMQESQLNPQAPNGGTAQWLGGRYTAMTSWVTSHGGDPSTLAGQLRYVVYEIRTTYPQLVTDLASATSPEQAATMVETVYERCSGVLAYMVVQPGSPCNDPQRRAYAAAAYQAAGGSAAVPVSLDTGSCAVAQGIGGDPIPGFTPGRDDMGVDASATVGMPIFAPAASQLVQIIPGWYQPSSGPEMLLLFKFTQPVSGAYQNDQYWFIAEQISPVTQTIGSTFSAGQEVASYAPSGTGIEIGWGSPTSTQRTLAGQDGDAAAANPPAGATTVWGETFKKAFGIPWVGRSP